MSSHCKSFNRTNLNRFFFLARFARIYAYSPKWKSVYSGGYVVVQFYPCSIFSFFCSLCMVMYDNELKTKENKN